MLPNITSIDLKGTIVLKASEKSLSANDTQSGSALKPSQATFSKKPCLVVNPPINKSNKTFVVLGVERGGTSMAAGVLRALGINMGERAGLNHEDPRFLSDDQGRLGRLIIQRNKELAIWGFKVPKSALMLEFYEKTLRNPYYVVVYRNIAAIADSWVQRGASREYISPIERTMTYYNEIFNFIRITRSPVILINYERAAQHKEELVKNLADFAGIILERTDLQKCVAVITGDGKGYVNLPEHYFLVEPTQRSLSEDFFTSSFQYNRALHVSEEGVYQHFRTQKDKIILTRANNLNFPKKFLMLFELNVPKSLDLQSNIFRIYFDFIGEFFPGHATRPKLDSGRNILYVETNGKVKRIAIGAMLADIRARFDQISFYELPTDGDLHDCMIASHKCTHQAQSGLFAAQQHRARRFINLLLRGELPSFIKKKFISKKILLFKNHKR